MIKSFKHKGLARFFQHDDRSGVNAQHCDRIERLLDRLDSVPEAADMNIPGFGFHGLTGNRKSEYSVKVSGNWRITFKFKGGHVLEVNLEDYH